MRRLGYAALGVGWFLLVGVVAFRLTFPEAALVERARYEVDRATRGGMSVDIGAVTPWWVGLKAHDVTLYQVDGEEGVALVHLDQARARVSPFSLLGGAPAVTGRVSLGDGDVAFYAVVAQAERGSEVRRLDVDASGFPLAALPPVNGMSLKGTGTLDLVIDLDAPEGMKKAGGEASLTGQNLIVEDVAPFGPMLQPLGILPVAIDEIDLALRVTQGKAEVKSGRIVSSLATVELAGEISLQDDLSRSRLKLDVTLELSEAAAGVERMLGASKFSDGKYHGDLSGSLGGPRFSWRSERATRPSSSRSVSSEPTDPTALSSRISSPDLDERRKRAEERRARALDAVRSGEGMVPGTPEDRPGRERREVVFEHDEDPGTDTEEPVIEEVVPEGEDLPPPDEEFLE